MQEKVKSIPVTILNIARRIPKPSISINGYSLLIVILTFILGWQLGHKDYSLKWKSYKPEIIVTNDRSPDDKINLDFKLFWDTWNLVGDRYIDKKAVDPEKLYYGAIQGMVSALGDPYTVFLPPQAQKATKEQLSGEFEGVGMELGYNKEKRLAVIAPLKNTPADRAGIKSGDIIVKIDGKDAMNLSLPEAVNLIRGQRGTVVTLQVFGVNDIKPREVKITRDTITVKSVEYEAKTIKVAEDKSSNDGNDGAETDQSSNIASNDSSSSGSPVETKTTKSGKTVAYIRLASFGEKTRSEWNEAVSNALAKTSRGVIIDVRNNPGGYLDAGVYIASEFLDGGDIVLQEDAQGNRVAQKVVRDGRMQKLPLVVLINKGSASASEILAGAIQDRKRGLLVGEQSFGKGTIQTAEDLAEGTGIHITIAKWLTPNGRWVHGVGLTPDVVVEMGDGKNGDLQLDRALEELDKISSSLN